MEYQKVIRPKSHWLNTDSVSQFLNDTSVQRHLGNIDNRAGGSGMVEESWIFLDTERNAYSSKLLDRRMNAMFILYIAIFLYS